MAARRSRATRSYSVISSPHALSVGGAVTTRIGAAILTDLGEAYTLSYAQPYTSAHGKAPAGLPFRRGRSDPTGVAIRCHRTLPHESDVQTSSVSVSAA